jgi:hypothetical protein
VIKCEVGHACGPAVSLKMLRVYAGHTTLLPRHCMKAQGGRATHSHVFDLGSRITIGEMAQPSQGFPSFVHLSRLHTADTTNPRLRGKRGAPCEKGMETYCINCVEAD